MNINRENNSGKKHLLFKEKPVNLLMNLGDKNNSHYVSLICRQINCTYAHTEKILDSFLKLNLVLFKKQGRRKYIELTKKGKKICGIAEDLLVACK